MRSEDQIGDAGNQRWGDFATVGDEVEGAVLVEPLEVNGPLDWVPFAAEAELAAVAGDRHGAQVELWRECAVDAELGLAGGAASGERRLVHEREADRALELVDVGAREEDGGSVGVDALDRLGQTVRGRIGEEGKHLVLAGDGRGLVGGIHPLTQIRGLTRATRRARPARSAAWTTASTCL